MKFYHVLKVLALVFCSTLLFSISGCSHSETPWVQLHYLGHSAFVMEFDNGVTVVTDYGHPNAWVEWGWDSPISDIGSLIPDVMTFSHQHHDDHYDPERIPAGVKYILTEKDSLRFNGLEIRPIRTCEDDPNVESNTSYLFTYKGMSILHLGDAQIQIMQIENEDVRDRILEILPQQVDLLLFPIEGKRKYIPQAASFVQTLKPKSVIPMHFWSEKYRDQFLNYIQDSLAVGLNYELQRIDGSHFVLTDKKDDEALMLVSLAREPFESFQIDEE